MLGNTLIHSLAGNLEDIDSPHVPCLYFEVAQLPESHCTPVVIAQEVLNHQQYIDLKETQLSFFTFFFYLHCFSK